MKALLKIGYYLGLTMIVLSCQSRHEPVPNLSGPIANKITDTIDSLFQMHQTIDTFVLGDANGDGHVDTAIVYAPVHAYPNPNDFSSGGCDDDSCLTRVYFSFSPIILEHQGALGFQTFFAVDDLNDDGIQEVACIPNWFQSCWQGLFIYSLNASGWQLLAKGTVFACAEEDFSQRVIKHGKNNFELVVMQWSADGGEIVDTSVFYKR